MPTLNDYKLRMRGKVVGMHFLFTFKNLHNLDIGIQRFLRNPAGPSFCPLPVILMGRRERRGERTLSQVEKAVFRGCNNSIFIVFKGLRKP